MYSKLSMHTSLHIIEKYSSYVIYTLVMLLYHKYMNLTTRDYQYFSNVLTDNNMFGWLIERYNTWSSRIGVEFVLALFSTININVFRIVDIIVNVGILYLITDLLNLRSLSSRMLLLALLLMLNIHDMGEAGWIPTMINYMWVVAALLIVVFYLKMCYYQRESVLMLCAAFLSVLFAGTHEQGVVILISIFLLFIYVFYSKYGIVNKTAVSLLVLSVILMVLILLAPGNEIRTMAEMNNPDASPLFLENNIVDKIWLGIIRFHSKFLFPTNHHLSYAFAIVLILHGLHYWNKGKKFDVILSFIPLFIIVGNAFFSSWLEDTFMPFTIDYDNIKFYVILFICTIFVLSTIVYFYRAFNLLEFIIISTTLLTGIITQILMGFTPTLYRSGSRTSIFLYFAFIMVSAFLFKDIDCYYNIKLKALKAGVVLLLLVIATIDSINSFLLLVPRGW